MNSEQVNALIRVLAHYGHDDVKHFREAGEPSGHIAESLLVLNHYMQHRQPAPPPNGDYAPEHPLGQAGPIGIVRDHPSHVDWENSRGPSVPDDVLESMRNKITWNLLNFASLPESVKAFVDSAMKGDDAALLRVAHRALLDYQTGDIPF